MAALGTTLAISLIGGALTGYIASRFGNLEYLFDDKEHFCHAEYDAVVEVAHNDTDVAEVRAVEMGKVPSAPDSARAGVLEQ